MIHVRIKYEIKYEEGWGNEEEEDEEKEGERKTKKISTIGEDNEKGEEANVEGKKIKENDAYMRWRGGCEKMHDEARALTVVTCATSYVLRQVCRGSATEGVSYTGGSMSGWTLLMLF